MIEKKTGKSHTGIVKKVNADGSFETVEGNCSNSVTTRTYAANSPTLSGFISLEQYAQSKSCVPKIILCESAFDSLLQYT